MQERVDEQQRDRIEQKGRDHLVDPEADAQHRRTKRPQRATRRSAGDHERDGDDLWKLSHLTDGRGRDGAHEQLPLGADVPVAAAESEGHRGAGEHDRRGCDKDLEHAEARGQGDDKELGVRLDRVRPGQGDGTGRHGERDEDGEDHEPRGRPG